MAYISQILSLHLRTKHFTRFTLSHYYTCGGGGSDDPISSDGGKESFISTNNQIKSGGEGDAPKGPKQFNEVVDLEIADISGIEKARQCNWNGPKQFNEVVDPGIANISGIEKARQCNWNVVMEKKIMCQSQSLRYYSSSSTNSPYITRKMPFQFGSCTLCKKKGYSIEFSPSSVMICLCCRSEFHVHCLKQHGIVDLKECPSSWFCSSMCGERFSSLMRYLENGEQEISDYFQEVIKKKHALVGFHKRLHIRWMILNSKLALGNEI